MCLILFAWQAHPRYPLIVAANREEFHERPTAAADFWEDHPNLLAGRDLQAGGTWLGVSRSGRFAAVTNFREPLAPELPLEHSRGELVSGFLQSCSSPIKQSHDVMNKGYAYRGFNLLVGTPTELAYASNRAEHAASIEPGMHGLSNHLLDTDWPKVQSGREGLSELMTGDRVSAEDLLELLTNRTLAPGDLPELSGNEELMEQLMRHSFIVSPVYGTRSSTVVLLDYDGNLEFVERQYAPSGVETFTRDFTFRINGD